MRCLGLISLLLCSALLPACKVLGDDDSDLAGSWQVKAVRVQRSTQAIPAGERYIFDFAEDGTLTTRSSGCNDCQGTYRVGYSGVLEISLACTRAGCDRLPELGAQLIGEQVYDVQGNRLYVWAKDGEHRSIELQRVAGP